MAEFETSGQYRFNSPIYVEARNADGTVTRLMLRDATLRMTHRRAEVFHNDEQFPVAIPVVDERVEISGVAISDLQTADEVRDWFRENGAA